MADEQWICMSCTMPNNAARSRCGMCLTDRPNQDNVPSEASTRPSEASTRPSEASTRPSEAPTRQPRWSCPGCTYQNPETNRSCQLCQSNKPESSNPQLPQVVHPLPAPVRQPGVPRVPAVGVDSAPCERPARGLEAPPQRQFDEEKVTALVQMWGCSQDYAKLALGKFNGDGDRAAMWLMDHPEPDSPAKPVSHVDEERGKREIGRQKFEQEQHEIEEKEARKKEDKRKIEERRSKEQQKRGAEGQNSQMSEKERAALKRHQIIAEAKAKKEAQERERRKAEADMRKLEEERKLRKIDIQEKLKAAEETKKLNKKRLEEEKSKSRLAWHAKQEEYERKEKVQIKQTLEKRKKREAAIGNITEAIDVLTNRYGVKQRNETLSFIHKVVGNILKHPDDAKYRSIKSDGASFVKCVETPLGGTAILKFLGFVAGVDGAVWELKCPNLALLKKEYDRFGSYVQTKNVEIICDQLQSVEEKSGAEAAYFAAQKLLELLDNVISLSNITMVRRINIMNSDFKICIGKYPPAVAILKSLGFKLRKQKNDDRFLVLPDNASPSDLEKIRNGVATLKKEVKNRLVKTPIFLCLRDVASANSVKIVGYITKRLSGCLGKIIAEPLGDKYQRIRVGSFFKKTGPVKGSYELFQCFGFRIGVENGNDFARFHAREDDIDLELLKIQRRCLEDSLVRLKL